MIQTSEARRQFPPPPGGSSRDDPVRPAAPMRASARSQRTTSGSRSPPGGSPAISASGASRSPRAGGLIAVETAGYLQRWRPVRSPAAILDSDIERDADPLLRAHLDAVAIWDRWAGPLGCSALCGQVHAPVATSALPRAGFSTNGPTHLTTRREVPCLTQPHHRRGTGMRPEFLSRVASLSEGSPTSKIAY